MAMMEFKNSEGQVIKLDDSLTLEQLVARGLSVHLRPKEEPPIPGAFYPTDEAMNNLLVKKRLIPEDKGVVIAPPSSKEHGQ